LLRKRGRNIDSKTGRQGRRARESKGPKHRQNGFRIRCGGDVLAVVLEPRSQADDKVVRSRLIQGLGQISTGVGEKLEPRNVDETGRLTAACMGMYQRRDQLHERQKADDDDARGLNHVELRCGSQWEGLGRLSICAGSGGCKRFQWLESEQHS